jgi:hypothetical protein
MKTVLRGLLALALASTMFLVLIGVMAGVAWLLYRRYAVGIVVMFVLIALAGFAQARSFDAKDGSGPLI